MRLSIDALWSPAGKGVTSWLSFVMYIVKLSLSHWYPGIPDLCPLSYIEYIECLQKCKFYICSVKSNVICENRMQA